jgi:acetyl esterase/lipase
MQSILEIAPPKADARIAYDRGVSQFGDLRMPRGKGPFPSVIYLHGGYWRAAYDLTHAGHICAALTKAGYATWNLEYRRIGESGGGWPGTMDDVLKGAQFVGRLATKYNLDLQQVVTAGHSAGGQLALWLAAQAAAPPMRGVTSLAGVCDLRRAWELKLSDTVVEQLLGGTPRQVPKRYALASPIELLPMKTPQRLLHGTADGVVPFEMSERFARASKNAKLIKLEGVGHFELIDPRAKEWPAVLKSVTQW